MVPFTNSPPVAEDDSYLTTQATALSIAPAGVMANDSDPDGQAISVSSYDPVSQFGGRVVMQPDGSFLYTPEELFCGYDTFEYEITDGFGGYDTATVTIEVQCINQRSVELRDMDGAAVPERLDTVFDITNQSGVAPGGRLWPAQVTEMVVVIEKKRGPNWDPVGASCTTDFPVPGLVEDAPARIWVACLFDGPIRSGQVRASAIVRIYGRDMDFALRFETRIQ